MLLQMMGITAGKNHKSLHLTQGTSGEGTVYLKICMALCRNQKYLQTFMNIISEKSNQKFLQTRLGWSRDDIRVSVVG